MSVSVCCPHCDSSLKLKQRESLGRKVRCPRCSTPFVAEEEAADEEFYLEDDYGEDADPYDDSADEWSEAPDSYRRSPAKRRSSGTRRPSSGSRSKDGQPPWLLIAGGVFGLLFLGIVLVGAVSRPRGNAANGINAGANGPVAVEAAATVNTGAPITEEEIQVFVAEMNAAIDSNSAAAVARLINLTAIVEKCMAGIEAPAQFQRGFRQGIGPAGPRLASEILASTQAGGSYRFLRSSNEGNVAQVLFRLSLPAGGMNYHRFDLIRDSTGKVASGDLFVFVSGEYMSTTLRRLYLPAAAQQSRSLLEKLTGTEADVVRHSDKLTRMQQLRGLGQHREILNVYNALPESLKFNKAILLIRLLSAQEVSEAEYLQAVEDFRRHFPGDASLNMLLIDYHVLKNEFADCYAAIDTLDQSLGGDPYLQVLRSSVMILEGRVDDAEAAMTELAKTDDVDLAGEATMAILSCALVKQDHDQTLEVLHVLRDTYGYQFLDLTTVEEYANFVRTPQYQQWLQSQ